MGTTSVNFDFNTLLKNIRSVAKALSLERILKVCLILFIGGFLFAFFERRIQILHAVMQPLVIKNTQPITPTIGVSKKHIGLLEKLLADSVAVNSVAVISVNIRENTKQIIYTDANKNLQKIMGTISLTSPLFSDNSDMNNRTVSLMSGDILCMESSKKNIGSIVPDLEKAIPFSCAIPIPPTYGDFSGWLFVGFERKLTDWELQQFRIEITKISTMIKRGA